MFGCELSLNCQYLKDDENFICDTCQSYYKWLEELKDFIAKAEKYVDIGLEYEIKRLEAFYDKALEEYMDFKIEKEI
jgi:hypothetical protein